MEHLAVLCDGRVRVCEVPRAQVHQGHHEAEGRTGFNDIMPMGKIIVNLDVEMAKRKMSLSELADRVGLTLANLSILKTGKAKAVRFTTLEAICRELGCQPGDILEYRDE
jgi:putative transcriptional regulator